jgi:hypothetical protein
MSRYEVNKLMRQITRDDAARESFLKNPEVFVEGRNLTDEERKALITKDFRTLYALGAHSFLLYSLVMTIFPGDRKELEKEYCKAIMPLGRIDYST